MDSLKTKQAPWMSQSQIDDLTLCPQLKSLVSSLDLNARRALLEELHQFSVELRQNVLLSRTGQPFRLQFFQEN